MNNGSVRSEMIFTCHLPPFTAGEYDLDKVCRPRPWNLPWDRWIKHVIYQIEWSKPPHCQVLRCAPLQLPIRCDNRIGQGWGMTKDAAILQWSLRAGAVYFTAIALAHTMGLKVPGLFIYFSVPSYPYQDHIIAFLAFGWAAFYFVASVDPAGNPLAVKGVILSSIVAIAGLARINFLDEVDAISPGVNLQHFWLQTAVLLVYVCWLFVFYMKTRR